MTIHKLELLVGGGPDTGCDKDFVDYILVNLPDNIEGRAKYVSSFDDKNNHNAISEDLHPLVLGDLVFDDYKKLGREFGKVDGITYAELHHIGKPIPRGGGGSLTQIIIDFLQSESPLLITYISSFTVILKTALELYFSKDNNLVLTVKRGDDEITIKGYSKDEAAQLIDGFFFENENQEENNQEQINST